MRILIVDDHAVVRLGLIQLLSPKFPDCIFGEAGNAGEALDRLGKETWDLLILDITLPGRSGLDALRQFRKVAPKTPVLMLSMHPEKEFAVMAFKRGASGYIAKERAPAELAAAVRKVLAGGRYISPAVVDSLASVVAGEAPMPPQELLSDREFQVMRMIASGKSVGGIADELSLSVKTISTFRARVLKKMKLRNNAEMMRYALDHQLVE